MTQTLWLVHGDITSHGAAGVWDREGVGVGPDPVWGEVLGCAGLHGA